MEKVSSLNQILTGYDIVGKDTLPATNLNNYQWLHEFFSL